MNFPSCHSSATIENNPGSLLLEDTSAVGDNESDNKLKHSVAHKFHQNDLVLKNPDESTLR